MNNHVHVGSLSFLITAAHVILVMFFMKWVALKWPDSPIGKALGTLN
jgi:hypothetical protein